MNDPLSWIDDEARSRADRGLSRRLRPHGPVTPGRITIDGKSVLNFGSNDYLGLAADPRLATAAQRAVKRYGWGAGASPLVTGWTEVHQALVEALAKFEKTEAAALFPTGFAASLGTIAALVGTSDVVYVDRLNHACLIDGARLSGARLRVYPHADADRLATILERDRGRFRRRMIATDGVFSMDGDLAPLNRLTDLAEAFDAMLLVDEAHGTGVHGPDGRGACSEHGVAERVPVRVGTLSKALGSIGGFVAGSRRLVEHVLNHAKTLIYSTSLPPAAVAASAEALAIVEREPWRRQQVRRLAGRLRPRAESGLIVPILVGKPERALELSAKLLALGFFVPAIRPPTVPDGTSRLRVSVTAAHSEEDLEGLIVALESAGASPGFME